MVGIQTSSITRDSVRIRLLEDAKAKQTRRRDWQRRIPKRSRAGDAKALAQRDHKIEELEKQNRYLIASHKAMILAVGEIGGMTAWRRFFEDYQHIIDELEALDAMPDAKVIPLSDGESS